MGNCHNQQKMKFFTNIMRKEVGYIKLNKMEHRESILIMIYLVIAFILMFAFAFI
jgi:hypothetical protein